MRRDVPSVAADSTLGEVLDAVTSTRLNRAVVVDAERRVLGVVTDADLLARLDPAAQTGLLGALMGRGPGPVELKATARDVMHAPALTVTADTPVGSAAQQMLEARRKVLPITDSEGHLLGVLDRADLLHHLRDFPQPA
jgi:CBS domain-containing protein